MMARRQRNCGPCARNEGRRRSEVQQAKKERERERGEGQLDGGGWKRQKSEVTDAPAAPSEVNWTGDRREWGQERDKRAEGVDRAERAGRRS